MFSDFSSSMEMIAVLVGIAAPCVTLTKARREGKACGSFVSCFEFKVSSGSENKKHRQRALDVKSRGVLW